MLEINQHKSKLMGNEVNSDDAEHLAEAIECLELQLPFKYIGLPLVSNILASTNRKQVVDNFRVQLCNWKVKILSICGH